MLRRFEIVNDSMQPALHAGDWVIALPLRGVPKRGAIIVFDHDDRPGLTLVKRVVGLPGERVAIAGERIHIDDITFAEPWVGGSTAPDGAWEVPRDAVFVLGDHRTASTADSRSLGPIELRDVEWRVVARYWPSSRIGFVGTD